MPIPSEMKRISLSSHISLVYLYDPYLKCFTLYGLERLVGTRIPLSTLRNEVQEGKKLFHFSLIIFLVRTCGIIAKVTNKYGNRNDRKCRKRKCRERERTP
jgi:hypothetical protein